MRGARLLAIWTGLALALAPPIARAQDGLGLDLTGDAGPDLRPSLAVIGVSSDPEDAELASALSSALLAAAQKQSGFNPVLTPDQAREALADNHADAAECADAACLDSIANTVGTERLLVAKLSREERRLKLELRAFARGQENIESSELEASGKSGLQKKLKSTVPALLGRISTALAMLKVTTNLSGATVSLGERELGQGSMEKPVPAGKYVLHVAAPEYSSYESEITLEPGGKLAVEANLTELPSTPQPARVAAAIKDPPPTATAKVSGAPVWSRPPLYVALAGAVVLGVGIAMGASTQGVANQVSNTSPGGTVDLTRAQVLGAQQNAQLANLLIGTGGALAAGGALWFALTPTPPPPASRESVGRLQPSGLQLVATGSF